MSALSLILFVVVGLAAGWLASLIMHGGLGLVGDLALGVAGAMMGGLLFNAFTILTGAGLLGALLIALCGSIVLLFLLRLVSRPRNA